MQPLPLDGVRSMTKRKISLMALSILFLLLTAYLLMRALATKEADRETDAFFARFSTAQQKIISPHGQDFTGALAVIERHREAIANFNYKKTTPDINLMLNEAVVPVSWHLTIIFRKENSGWHVSKFEEHLASS